MVHGPCRIFKNTGECMEELLIPAAPAFQSPYTL